MIHYSRHSLAAALAEAGLKRGDIAFCHNNVGFLGIPEGERTQQNTCETVLGAFQDVLGPQGTLVVPTFTYSFSQGEVFDPDQTPSTCGMFTEFIRCHPQSRRYEDPNISVSAIGYDAEDLTCNAPVHAYGENSFFDRFYRRGGVIANINFDAGSTFVHYVERELGVPYRFDKEFIGIFSKDGVQQEKASILSVRYLDDRTEAVFEPFTALAQSRGLYKVVKVGRGMVGLITARQTYDLIQDALPERPWLLTKADAMDQKPDVMSFKK